MLGTKERGTTKVTLEFLGDVMPVFEKFLFLFQKASLVIHVVYDNMCDTLLKLMRRFMKPQTTEKKYGTELVSIQCTDTKLQLVDEELIIRDATQKVLVTTVRQTKTCNAWNESILQYNNFIPAAEVTSQK